MKTWLCTGLGKSSMLLHLALNSVSLISTWIHICFRQAADNGHPGGAYNLVAGHLQGYKSDLQEQ